jgi:hypothetical protein
VGVDCRGDRVGEGERRDVGEHGAGVALSSYQAIECGCDIAGWHDGFNWPVGVSGGDGADVCAGHVAPISLGVHDFMYVADNELGCVGFEGGDAVS